MLEASLIDSLAWTEWTYLLDIMSSCSLCFINLMDIKMRTNKLIADFMYSK